MIRGRILCDGEGVGPMLLLEAPLSFWGGFDPASGAVIDRHHPQAGLRLAGAVVLMAESRGSATAPGTLAEAIRLKRAPSALVLVKPDVNLAIGAKVAMALYGASCPILAVSESEFETLKSARRIAIAAGGLITVET